MKMPGGTCLVHRWTTWGVVVGNLVYAPYSKEREVTLRFRNCRDCKKQQIRER